MIYEIYDHRLENAPEINGATNTCMMSMEEHLICFFIGKYKSRNEIERNLIEFLAGLKYYAEAWPRAKLFAIVYSFYQVDDVFFNKRHSGNTENRFPPRLNDGKASETDFGAYNDLYTQEFFLLSYSLLSRERTSYVDSQEGFTYLKM
jgi:hypothetical protein